MKSGFSALFFVYLVWGSTFLAIRLAVSGEGAFAPYSLAAIRTAAAGLLLLACALLKKESLRIGWANFRALAITGVLLWIGGHALVIWAVRRMDSGLAALIFASSPLWGALLSACEGRLGLRQLWPVLAGFAGIALVFPLEQISLGQASLLDALALLFSAFLWALGTVVAQRSAQGVPLFTASGVQLLVAGIGTSMIALASGEGWPQPSQHAWLACAYLVLFGTVLAYLAYSHCMRVLPTAWVMSFAYVNPIVAVMLGVLLLGEKITMRGFAGMVIVLVSVIWLFAGNRQVQEEAR